MHEWPFASALIKQPLPSTVAACWTQLGRCLLFLSNEVQPFMRPLAGALTNTLRRQTALQAHPRAPEVTCARSIRRGQRRKSAGKLAKTISGSNETSTRLKLTLQPRESDLLSSSRPASPSLPASPRAEPSPLLSEFLVNNQLCLPQTPPPPQAPRLLPSVLH